MAESGHLKCSNFPPFLLKAVEITPTECGWWITFFVTEDEAQFLCLVARISHFHQAVVHLPAVMAQHLGKGLELPLRTMQTTRRPWGRWRWWRGRPPRGSCSGRPLSSPPSPAASKARFAGNKKRIRTNFTIWDFSSKATDKQNHPHRYFVDSTSQVRLHYKTNWWWRWTWDDDGCDDDEVDDVEVEVDDDENGIWVWAHLEVGELRWKEVYRE